MLTTFRLHIKAGGRSYTGDYISSGLAVLLAQCFHRVHNASAMRVTA